MATNSSQELCILFSEESENTSQTSSFAIPSPTNLWRNSWLSVCPLRLKAMWPMALLMRYEETRAVQALDSQAARCCISISLQYCSSVVSIAGITDSFFGGDCRNLKGLHNVRHHTVHRAVHPGICLVWDDYKCCSSSYLIDEQSCVALHSCLWRHSSGMEDCFQIQQLLHLLRCAAHPGKWINRKLLQ